jgi:hypothetical protein
MASSQVQQDENHRLAVAIMTLQQSHFPSAIPFVNAFEAFNYIAMQVRAGMSAPVTVVATASRSRKSSKTSPIFTQPAGGRKPRPCLRELSVEDPEHHLLKIAIAGGFIADGTDTSRAYLILSRAPIAIVPAGIILHHTKRFNNFYKDMEGNISFITSSSTENTADIFMERIFRHDVTRIHVVALPPKYVQLPRPEHVITFFTGVGALSETKPHRMASAEWTKEEVTEYQKEVNAEKLLADEVKRNQDARRLRAKMYDVPNGENCRKIIEEDLLIRVAANVRLEEELRQERVDQDLRDAGVVPAKRIRRVQEIPHVPVSELMKQDKDRGEEILFSIPDSYVDEDYWPTEMAKITEMDMNEEIALLSVDAEEPN